MIATSGLYAATVAVTVLQELKARTAGKECMIFKEKSVHSGASHHSSDARGFYGHKQEQDVTFHLLREFGEHEQIHVINDLRCEHRG